MNDHENSVIERSIEDLTRTISQLVRQKSELEERIAELEAIQSTLLRLLPPNKRIV